MWHNDDNVPHKEPRPRGRLSVLNDLDLLYRAGTRLAMIESLTQEGVGKRLVGHVAIATLPRQMSRQLSIDTTKTRGNLHLLH